MRQSYWDISALGCEKTSGIAQWRSIVPKKDRILGRARYEKLKIHMFYLLSERISVTFDIRGLHRSLPKEYSCEDYRLKRTARWCVFRQKLADVWKIVPCRPSEFTSDLKLKTAGYSGTQCSARLHGVTSQKTVIFMVSEMRISDLTNIVGPIDTCPFKRHTLYANQVDFLSVQKVYFICNSSWLTVGSKGTLYK
jgi:hypothetical protein